MKNVENLSYITKDIIQGDMNLIDRGEFSEAELDDIKKALNIIINNPNLSDKEKKNLLLNTWRLTYKVKPPSIEEFLSYKWIGGLTEELFPHVKKVLIDFFQPNTKYRNLLLAPHIGWGKSTLSVLANLYITVNLWCMHNAKKTLGLSPTTNFVQALISFTKDKSRELMLDPFTRILEISDKFVRCRTEEIFIRKNKIKNDPNIYYTTAGTFNLQFSGNLNYKIASSPGDILGLTIISSTMSELSFFVEQRGFSPDIIWSIYQDSKNRIESRLKGHYWGRTIMDSSPNDRRLPIDHYIFSGEANNDPTNYVVIGPEWKYKKNDFSFKKMFPVFKGSSTQAAQILSENEVKNYNENEVIWIPEKTKSGDNYRIKFEQNLIKSLKDHAGVPAGSDDYLITNPFIIEQMFYENLKNVYTYIMAPANRNPEKLIWDQIAREFFIHYENNNYEFYRAAQEYRYLHVDQSLSGDITSIAMVHPEIDKKGQNIIIVDFTINIRPDKDRVNLDAIIEFIQDLIRLGKIKIGKITFDQYQSAVAQQRLARYNVDVKHLSVDKEPEIYHLIISWIKNNRIKSGRNIFLKNNLKSVKDSKTSKGKRKVDHCIGKIVYEDGGDWTKSQMGINAKDTSDALIGACYNLIQDYQLVPRYQWEEEIMKQKLSKKEAVEHIKKKAMERVYAKYSLKLK